MFPAGDFCQIPVFRLIVIEGIETEHSQIGGQFSKMCIQDEARLLAKAPGAGG